jgi:F-type H+-transporting ATPase subunit a
VLLLNLIGLIPGTFAQTSHISITFTLAMMIFLVCVLATIAKKGLGFFKIFLPEGTPLWMAPLMFVLEFFSYLVRPVSLSVRLAANMIAGHVMLDVIAFFVITLGSVMFALGLLPFAFLVVLMAFEVFVAFLQAYIFSIFACVYINEAAHGGH